MMELVFFLVAGAVFLLAFLVWFLATAARSTAPQDLEDLKQIVSLRGLAFVRYAAVLDDGDYMMLRSKASFRLVAAQLLRERREIVLLWLKLLQEDVTKLWRFRRLLVGHGVPVTLPEEFRIAMMSVFALTLLFVLRIVVAVAGPFALPRLVLATRRNVETASRLCAAIVSRVPAPSRIDLERKWAAASGAVAR